MTTSGEPATWEDCLGADGAWLLRPLLHRLRYAAPLPVQHAVAPSVSRAFLSGLPMDICLTAPTGSGKTLCYLLPMLRLVTACKKGIDHTRLRGLVLVPTKALGQQVLREVSELIGGTSITAYSLCGETSVKEEAEALVRTVKTNAPSGMQHEADRVRARGEKNEKERDGEGEGEEWDEAQKGTPHCYYYYSRVDILITTPQRLLCHLDTTAGLSLADLRLLVIDEADQVLAGNFTNFVTKVVERFEAEQSTLLPACKESSVGESRRLAQMTFRLHKILCSATLSSHIARISEVRLRNCRHFTLDSYGTDIRREDEGEPLLPLPSPSNGESTRSKKGGSRHANEAHTQDGDIGMSETAQQTVVRTSFALPPRLQEHIVFVEDWYRHAVLLKLVRAIMKQQNTTSKGNQTHSNNNNNNNNNNTNNNDNMKNSSSKSIGGDGAVEGMTEDADVTEMADEHVADESDTFRALGHRPKHRGRTPNLSISSPTDYPSCEDDAGRRILVFCRSADEARVMGHFLLAAGVPTIEFTTLATESERRRALLKSASDACIVASDALMRGVDVPGVGHVIMYSPPETLAQYVHRAGRTARAMRAGHLHVLLQKTGQSGTQRDGEVAMFKSLSSAVSRSCPMRYERYFFMFDRPPGEVAQQKRDPAAPKDKAQLLIDEANVFLQRTRARLMGQWVSALESSKVAETSVNVNANTEGKGGTGLKREANQDRVTHTEKRHSPIKKRERKAETAK